MDPQKNADAGLGMAQEFAVLDRSHFVLVALKAIIGNASRSSCVRTTVNPSVFIETISTGSVSGDAIIYLDTCNYSMLFIIHYIIQFKVRHRIIVMLEDEHAPTLQLMRCMGVRFIVSRRDKICHLQHILCNSTLTSYVTGKHSVTHQGYSDKGFFCGRGLFTPSEGIILIELLNGLSPVRVAKKYSISVKTVSVHKCNALKKMGFKNMNVFLCGSC
ncbi:LuxR C-terminal-related transcriptional regulator [Serratia ficaria]|uniref:LuxR C-terminal-related transcriptional regulator n=1 Tax=Serratia ficaria TaxID=61651 RepID=UPI0021776137|nr:LuxR C-terminal-related transcriptional regulator [Serratia ficaria]CAI1125979.1 Bacterial regulatory proteins, luxR family [Serratia ficaria]CAI1539663.1 Bacterial regulatory proteins, luxR family [Serratia ficaria]